MAKYWCIYDSSDYEDISGNSVCEEIFHSGDKVESDEIAWIRKDVADRHPELTFLIQKIAKMEVEGAPELEQLKAEANLRKAEAKILKRRQKLHKALEKLEVQKDAFASCMPPQSGV